MSPTGGKRTPGDSNELSNGARIWFYLSNRQVILMDVHTHHPNQTK